MSTSQSTYMEACASALSASVLRTLAQNIKSRMDDLKTMGEDDLVAEFHRVLQLPGQPARMAAPGANFPAPGFPPMGAPSGGLPGFPQPGNPGFPQPGNPGFSQQGPGFPPMGAPTMGHLAPALSGGGFQQAPGMMNGMSAASTTKRSGKKPDPHWMSVQEYAAHKQQGQRMCAYCPSRGDHKGRVCCIQQLFNPQAPDPYDFRCDQHKAGAGNIKTMMGGAATTGVMPPQGHPGFNMPPQGFPGMPQQGMPPQFGQQQMPQQQSASPAFAAERNPSLPEKYPIGVRNQTTGSDDVTGWLFYADPPNQFVVLGKFGGHVPNTHKFEGDWTALVQPLDENEQRRAAAAGLKYSYKATLNGGQPLPQPTPSGLPSFGQSGGMPLPPQGMPQQGMPMPQQGLPPQGLPQGMPMPQQGLPQGMPMPMPMPQQGLPQGMQMPPQGLPSFGQQGGMPLPPQGLPQGGMPLPPQGLPQGMPQQQMPAPAQETTGPEMPPQPQVPDVTVQAPLETVNAA